MGFTLFQTVSTLVLRLLRFIEFGGVFGGTHVLWGDDEDFFCVGILGDVEHENLHRKTFL